MDSTTTNTDVPSTEPPTADDQQSTVTTEESTAAASPVAPVSKATSFEAKLTKLKTAEGTIKELLGLGNRTKAMLGKKLNEVNQILMDMPEDQAGVAEWQVKVSNWWRQYLGSPLLDQNKWKPILMNDRWSSNGHYPQNGVARFPGAFPGGQLPSYRPPWYQPTVPPKRHVWMRLGTRDCRPNINPSNAESSNSELMVSFPGGNPATEIPRLAPIGPLPSANSWTEVSTSKRSHSPEPGDDDKEKNAAHCSRKRFKRGDSSSPDYGDDEDDEYVSRGFRSLPDLTEESPSSAVNVAGDQPTATTPQTDVTCILCRRDSHHYQDCPGELDICDNCFSEGHTSADCTDENPTAANVDVDARPPLDDEPSSD